MSSTPDSSGTYQDPSGTRFRPGDGSGPTHGRVVYIPDGNGGVVQGTYYGGYAVPNGK